MARSQTSRAVLLLAVVLCAGAVANAEPLCVSELKLESSTLSLGGKVIKPLRLSIKPTSVNTAVGNVTVAFNGELS